MKAFWWYEENAVAGMARPGFNQCRWFDLPFDEAVLMGWLGQHSGDVPLASFREHLRIYAPKVAAFYPLTPDERKRAFDQFNDPAQFARVLERLAKRTRFFKEASLENDHLRFEIDHESLNSDIAFLKAKKIRHIVSLTEKHHGRDHLAHHFDLTHISIVDMEAPTREQAEALASLMTEAEKRGESLAVHCLAGIGRTSTMIMAAEMLRGKSLPELLEKVRRQNPVYAFAGSQATFLTTLAAKINS